ncbi:MAG: transcriptional regulator, partial [Actinobacteria bacterium]
MADVKRLEAATGVFRALDYQYGGGACRDAVHAQLCWGEQLLRAEGIDAVKDRFEVALADLHNLAGWTWFDTGLASQAYRHFRHALDLAHWGGDDALVANV